MGKKQRFLAVFAALILLLGICVSSALAATGIAQSGKSASLLDDNLFIVISSTDLSALKSVPLSGGDFAHVDMSVRITNLITAGDKLYYLRNDEAMTQLIQTSGDGSALNLLCEWENMEITHMSFYDEMLYCLVDGILTIIDPATGDPDEINIEVTMSEYAIVNDIVYFVSATDIEHYSRAIGGKTATGASGKLYLMPLIPSTTSSEPQCILDQGISDLQVHGDYLYLHNMDDGYPIEGGTDTIFIKGKLYRMHMQTNQLEPLNIPYDWAYAATSSGVLVYSNQDVSLYPLGGGAAKLLMTPEMTAYVMADADNAYVYEPVRGALTLIPLAGGDSSLLYQGGPIVELIDNTSNKGAEPLLDENGDPVLDEDGNPVYAQVPEEEATDDDGDDSKSTTPTANSGSKKDSTYIFRHSNTKKLTRAQILDISKSNWRRARNEIYARHGYVFKDADLKKYFGGKTWYKAGGFSTGKLNKTEWYNMELILAMEKEYGLDGAKEPSSSTGSGRIKLNKNVFSTSSTKKLTRSQLKGLSANKLATARNEILARHGYPFKQKKWIDYFSGTGWKARSNYSYSNLNSIENYNIKLIKEYE